jgi:hypothetical protein
MQDLLLQSLRLLVHETGHRVERLPHPIVRFVGEIRALRMAQRTLEGVEFAKGLFCGPSQAL